MVLIDVGLGCSSVESRTYADNCCGFDLQLINKRNDKFDNNILLVNGANKSKGSSSEPRCETVFGFE